jgi:energy-coupling factor transport system ATP-binding protein
LKTIIEVKDLWHIYPGVPPTIALSGINLNVYEGEMLAVIGQNGSGKTTLVKHFNGLLKPTKGVVKVFEIDTKNVHPSELCKRVGYVFQNPDHMLFSKTIDDEVRFGPKNLGLPKDEMEKRVREALEVTGLTGFKDEFPRTLPLIFRVKTAIASVLALDPDVIIFDEPTTGQDARGSRELLEYAIKLNEKGKTIIFITHDMDLVANYAHRAVVLHNGKILIEGTPMEIFDRPEILASTFLEPPYIMQFIQKLKELGILKENVRNLNQSEIIDYLSTLIKNKRNEQKMKK